MSNKSKPLHLQSVAPSLNNAYDLTPDQFEHEVAFVFEKLISKARKTPVKAEVCGGVGDGGVDIELFDNTGTRVAIIQAKRHNPTKALPPGYLRDLDSCRRRSGVARAFLVTTARYSQSVRNQAAQWKIDLVDGAKFEQYRRSVRGLDPSAPVPPPTISPLQEILNNLLHPPAPSRRRRKRSNGEWRRSRYNYFFGGIKISRKIVQAFVMLFLLWLLIQCTGSQFLVSQFLHMGNPAPTASDQPAMMRAVSTDEPTDTPPTVQPTVKPTLKPKQTPTKKK